MLLLLADHMNVEHNTRIINKINGWLSYAIRIRVCLAHSVYAGATTIGLDGLAKIANWPGLH